MAIAEDQGDARERGKIIRESDALDALNLPFFKRHFESLADAQTALIASRAAIRDVRAAPAAEGSNRTATDEIKRASRTMKVYDRVHAELDDKLWEDIDDGLRKGEPPRSYETWLAYMQQRIVCHLRGIVLASAAAEGAAGGPSLDEIRRPVLEPLLEGIRGAGWTVACHNDYRLNGKAYTYWSFHHPNGRWAKGEGETDIEALTDMLSSLSQPADEAKATAPREHWSDWLCPIGKPPSTEARPAQEAGEKCPRCRGKGEIATIDLSDWGSERCPDCRGTGRLSPQPSADEPRPAPEAMEDAERVALAIFLSMCPNLGHHHWLEYPSHVRDKYRRAARAALAAARPEGWRETIDRAADAIELGFKWEDDGDYRDYLAKLASQLRALAASPPPPAGEARP